MYLQVFTLFKNMFNKHGIGYIINTSSAKTSN